MAVLVLLSVAPSLIKTISEHVKTYTKPVSQVVQIDIKGPIQDTQPHYKYLSSFFKDPNIKGIILQIDSPGGAAGTSQVLFQEILKLKEKYPKPVVALVDNVCASGAYYIAAATDYIIAPPSAIVGSIGVYMGGFNYKKLLDQIKVKQKLKQAGKFKTTFNPYAEGDTHEQEAMIQRLVDNTYDQFVKDVAKQRGLLVKKKSEWADGKIFTAQDALRLGLINKTGSISDAEEKIKSLGKIESEILLVKPAPPSPFKQMMGIQETGIQEIIQSAVQYIKQELTSENFKIQAHM